MGITSLVQQQRQKGQKGTVPLFKGTSWKLQSHPFCLLSIDQNVAGIRRGVGGHFCGYKDGGGEDVTGIYRPMMLDILKCDQLSHTTKSFHKFPWGIEVYNYLS